MNSLRRFRRFGSAGFRRGVAVLASLTVAVGIVLAVAGPASAHATLEGSSPAQSAVVASAPRQVTLTFDEAVGISADSIRVFDPSGNRVDDGITTTTSSLDEIGIGLRSGLGTGTYTVAWHVISDDSHPVEGAFVFSVGAASSTKVSETSINVKSSAVVGLFYGALRWLGYLGYALLFGGFAFLALCWPSGASDRRSFRLLAIGWTASLVSAIGVLVVQGAYAGELPLGSALDPSVLGGTVDTRFGQLVVARVLLLALAAPLLVATLSRLSTATARGRACFLATIGVFGVLGAATWAAGDHASTGTQVPLAVFSDLVHLTSMGLWIGGLAALLLILTRPAYAPQSASRAASDSGSGSHAASVSRTASASCAASGPGSRSASASRTASASHAASVSRTASSSRVASGPGADLAAEVAAVQSFSRLALCCVAALVASGVYQAWRNVGSWAALSGTPYGRIVVLKIGGLCVLAGLGWMARDWIRRTVQHTGRVAVALEQRMEPAGLLARLRRSVALEAGVALVVLALSSILVNGQPGRTAQLAQAGPTNATLPFGTGTSSGTITVYVGPGTAGLNQAHLYLSNAKGLPYKAAQITLRFTLPAQRLGPLTATVVSDGPGHYADQPLGLDFPGTWTLSVTIRSDDINETTLTVPVTISP